MRGVSTAVRIVAPAAAPRVLAELSHSTQVMVFTHHRHLLELARATLEADLFCVHELQPLCARATGGGLTSEHNADPDVDTLWCRSS